MRDTAAFMIILALVGCVSQPESPLTPAPTPGPVVPDIEWITKAAMPIPRTEVTCATLDDKIYLVGGFTATNTPTNAFHRYDPANDQWTPLADFPLVVHHTGLVAHQGDIYAFGGYTGALPFLGSSTLFRYDPTTNAWSSDGMLPRARGAHATILLGDEVYLVGGAPQQPGTETHANTDVYNLTTRSWRVGPSMGATREHLAGAAADATAIAVGGRRMSLTNFDTTESLQRGDPAWAPEDPMPTARGGIAAASWDSLILVFGGERSGGTHNETEAFDVASGRWTELAAMPHARHGLCAAPTSVGIHVIGGGPQAGLSTSNYHEVLRFVG